jgi:hypothetical protein
LTEENDSGMRVWLLLIALAFMGCQGRRGLPERDLSELEAGVREGDVVFRRGRGVMSRAVLTADRRGVYSHTGIVVRDSAGWRVVHAVPGEEGGDRVKMEPLSVFFQPRRAEGGAVMRAGDSIAARKAAERAVTLFRRNIPFDHDYDLDDTTRMYCTELIHHVFAHEGIDLTGGRRSWVGVPGFAGDYILPGDLQRSGQVTMIFEF